METDSLNSHFFLSPSHSLQRCLAWQDRQTVLVGARDVSADRKPASTGGCQKCLYWQETSQYGGLPEISLLTGNQSVLGNARDVSADRKPASTGGCQKCLCWQETSQYRGCQRCLCWQETSQYWRLPEMSLLRGPPVSTGAARALW
jgi:hypothetical protein